jgi:hypothetical protein
MFIPDPGSDFFPSRIRTVSIPDPESRILIKEFKYFNPRKAKKWFLSSKKYDPSCSSRIRMLTFSHPGSRIQGSKRHPIPDPDPQHCFFLLVENMRLMLAALTLKIIAFNALISYQFFFFLLCLHVEHMEVMLALPSEEWRLNISFPIYSFLFCLQVEHKICWLYTLRTGV